MKEGNIYKNKNKKISTWKTDGKKKKKKKKKKKQQQLQIMNSRSKS